MVYLITVSIQEDVLASVEYKFSLRVFVGRILLRVIAILSYKYLYNKPSIIVWQW